MKKPYVILTMLSSIDGKIEGDFIHEHNENLGNWFEYQKLENVEAWGNGSNTHEKYFSDKSIDLSRYAGTEKTDEDFVMKKEAPYLVSFDSTGKVLWNTECLIFPDDVRNHVLVVTTKRVEPEYTAYLREQKIPYIFAGNDAISLPTALDKLYTLFGIKRFAIVGGSTINAAFIKENLVDEIRLLIAPFIDGSREKTITETPDNIRLTKQFSLDSVNRLEDDGVLIIYKKNICKGVIVWTDAIF